MHHPKPDLVHRSQPHSRQCDRCMFRFANAPACVGFPRGIPAEIWSGRFDHTRPYPGDGDIRFLQRRGGAPAVDWDEV